MSLEDVQNHLCLWCHTVHVCIHGKVTSVAHGMGQLSRLPQRVRQQRYVEQEYPYWPRIAAGLSHYILDHSKTGLDYTLERYSSVIESKMSWLLSHGMFAANVTYLSMISSDLTGFSFSIITRVNSAHSFLVLDWKFWYCLSFALAVFEYGIFDASFWLRASGIFVHLLWGSWLTLPNKNHDRQEPAVALSPISLCSWVFCASVWLHSPFFWQVWSPSVCYSRCPPSTPPYTRQIWKCHSWVLTFTYGQPSPFRNIQCP